MSNIHVKKIVFYTIGHNGDIHYSKEFIKDIITQISNVDYEYRMQASAKLVKDIPRLLVKSFDLHHIYTNEVSYDETTHTLFINTWIGSSSSKYIPHETGCSLKANYDKYTDVYSTLGITIKSIENYIPNIDWSFYDINQIDTFLKINDKKLYCLICNGNVLSGQSQNFDFTEIIKNLSNKFNDVGFILTNSSNKIHNSNIFYTDDIIKTVGGDLNEIGYLATKCNLIVGRASGPYCFCHNTAIMNDNSKTLVVFTNLKNDGCWVSPDLIKDGAKQIWSNNFDLSSIYDIIETEIRKKYE